MNPIWNFTSKHPINILTEDYKPIKITIKNDGAIIDDALGTIDLDWKECFANPTMW